MEERMGEAFFISCQISREISCALRKKHQQNTERRGSNRSPG